MHLRLVRPASPLRRRHGARPPERPSLAIAVARSLALALCFALTVLAQVARGQSAPPAASSTTG
ncbi:MAG: hypothetical protein ABMA00_13820, partial [Gemmatimonas sp.]